MKKYIIVILLLTSCLSIHSQDNRQRAESMAAIATQRELKGGALNDFNPIFEQAISLAPDYAELYTLWGAVLAKHAEKINDTELMKLSFTKFEKSVELNPQQNPALLYNAYYAWGAGLAFLSMKTEDDGLLPLCSEKFSKAIELKPSATAAYQLWGELLLHYGRKNKDLLQLKETVSVYDKALAIEPNSLPALLGKGYAYLCMGRYDNDYLKYRSQLEAAYVRAEQLGGQSAAYNLACFYSLIKEKDEAFRWLEKTIVKNPMYERKMSEFSKTKFDKDADFDNIRGDKRYKELMKRYFSE